MHFLFYDSLTTEIYTLSLHDALPIFGGGHHASNAEMELQRLRAEIEARNRQETAIAELGQAALTGVEPLILLGQACALDRKSTRLNSSHSSISYAVFCLKKKI